MYVRREMAIDDAERARRYRMADYWHLLRTAPNRLDDARLFLEDMGVATAAPLARGFRRVRARRYGEQHEAFRRPALDGYLFLGVMGRGVMWFALERTRLFTAVVAVGLDPVRLSRHKVDEVMERAAAGEFDETAPGAGPRCVDLRPGDRARIVGDGAFTGFDVPVRRVNGDQALVEVSLLGKQNCVWIGLDQLRRAV